MFARVACRTLWYASLVVGMLALLRREARSVLLIAVSAVVAVEIAWVVVFAVSID